jgi:hypothetical protein
MSPTNESAAAAQHQAAARAKRLSMISAVTAARIIAVKMKPCSSANAPRPARSNAASVPSSDSVNGGPSGIPTPPARSPFFIMSVPHAAMPGSSPTATAGAWRSGVASNDCATMTTPIQSTMAMPASIGTASATRPAAPVRHSTVANAPPRIE